jgi:MinD-like ATPase involved in chromosome partitioning or flagellar assembly
MSARLPTQVRGGSADQAAGLRSLLGRRALRVLAVSGDPEAGAHAACAAQLAVSLSRAGHSVVLLDACGGALAALGLSAPADLDVLIRGELDFGAVAVRGGPDLRVLDARIGLPSLIESDAAGPDFFSGFLRLSEPASLLVMALPAIAGPAGRLWLPFFEGGNESLLVSGPGERAITAAYAIVKQAHAGLAAAGGTAHAPSFRLLVNGAEGEREARALCRQLSDTARRFLGATVGYAGNVPCNARGQAFGSSAVPLFAEAGRSFSRLAAEVPGWRLPECMVEAAATNPTH